MAQAARTQTAQLSWLPAAAGPQRERGKIPENRRKPGRENADPWHCGRRGEAAATAEGDGSHDFGLNSWAFPPLFGFPLLSLPPLAGPSASASSRKNITGETRKIREAGRPPDEGGSRGRGSGLPAAPGGFTYRFHSMLLRLFHFSGPGDAFPREHGRWLALSRASSSRSNFFPSLVFPFPTLNSLFSSLAGFFFHRRQLTLNSLGRPTRGSSRFSLFSESIFLPFPASTSIQYGLTGHFRLALWPRSLSRPDWSRRGD